VNAFLRAVDRLLQGAALVGGAALLLMAVMVTTDVLLRTVTGRPVTGVFEATETMLVAVIFLVLGLVEWQHRQLNVDILTGATRGRLRLAFTVLDKGLTSLVLGILLWLAANEWLKAWQGNFLRRGMVEIPTVIPLGLLVVGTALAMLAAAVGLLRALRCLVQGRPMPVPGGGSLGDSAATPTSLHTH
jgi:TRAP-type C4-dicarboxylate transport system permease small subunit